MEVWTLISDKNLFLSYELIKNQSWAPGGCMLGERKSGKYLCSHSGDFCLMAAFSWSPLTKTLLLSCSGRRGIATNKSGQGRRVHVHLHPPQSHLILKLAWSKSEKARLYLPVKEPAGWVASCQQPGLAGVYALRQALAIMHNSFLLSQSHRECFPFVCTMTSPSVDFLLFKTLLQPTL